MKIVVLGRGKTGSLVAQVARDRGHDVQALGAAENHSACGLTSERLAPVDAVIDFTTPHAILENIAACLRARTAMVVGTTGWYSEMPGVRQLVAECDGAFLYGANFSVGVNLFYDIARTAANALQDGYLGQIFERHHTHKKDAPSGTAAALQAILGEKSSPAPEITSFREGEVVGMHEIVLNSAHDTIYLCHDAKSRRGFAEGAVRAAEWLVGKPGFYDFKDVWRKL